jgi:hypothetical protein
LNNGIVDGVKEWAILHDVHRRSHLSHEEIDTCEFEEVPLDFFKTDKWFQLHDTILDALSQSDSHGKEARDLHGLRATIAVSVQNLGRR